MMRDKEFGCLQSCFCSYMHESVGVVGVAHYKTQSFSASLSSSSCQLLVRVMRTLKNIEGQPMHDVVNFKRFTLELEA